MNETTQITPFRIEVLQVDLDDLADRLARTRWTQELPEAEVTDGVQKGPIQPGWEYGVPLSFVQDLVARWRDEYDWRAWEAKINAFPQFTTEIDIGAHGNDAGAIISPELGRRHGDRIIGVHVNQIFSFPTEGSVPNEPQHWKNVGHFDPAAATAVPVADTSRVDGQRTGGTLGGERPHHP